MNQKIQKNGKGDVRYFWNVSIAGSGTGEYRSRHSTIEGVRNEFKKHGQRVLKVKPAAAMLNA